METALQEQNSTDEACLARTVTETKKCPFCAEQIQAQAIKCRYCGEFLDRAAGRGESRPTSPGPRPPKWYFCTSTVVVALLCLGPLALPLVWLNPRYKGLVKLLITAGVLALTLLLCHLAMNMYQNLMEQIKALGLG